MQFKNCLFTLENENKKFFGQILRYCVVKYIKPTYEYAKLGIFRIYLD